MLALYVLDLVRRRQLSEEYSLLWVGASLTIAVLGFATPLLRFLTRALGILFESSTVFAFGLAFAVAMLLYLSVQLSRLGQENQLLARELALLRRASVERQRAAPARGARERDASSSRSGSSISAVCVWLSMRDVRIAEVWTALRQATAAGCRSASSPHAGRLLDPRVALALAARRAAKPISLDSLYSATMIGFMANNLLPLRLGEFVRAWALGRRENCRRPRCSPPSWSSASWT